MGNVRPPACEHIFVPDAHTAARACICAARQTYVFVWHLLTAMTAVRQKHPAGLTPGKRNSENVLNGPLGGLGILYRSIMACCTNSHKKVTAHGQMMRSTNG